MKPRVRVRCEATATAAVLLAVMAGCTTEPEPGASPRMPQMLGRTAPSSMASVDPAAVAREARRLAADGDPAGAMRALETIPDLAARGGAIRDVVTTLANEDPARAARFALAIPPGAAAAAAIEAVAREWARRDAAAALGWAHGLEDSTARYPALGGVVDELVAQDPRAALTRIENLPPSPVRLQALALAAGRWARRDADAALTWARGIEDDGVRARIVTAIGFELAQTQPRRAVALADDLPESRERWLLLAAIGRTWVAHDTDAALRWAQQLPAGPARDAAVGGVEAGLGVHSPRTAALTTGPLAASIRRSDPDTGPFPAAVGPGAVASLPSVERERELRRRFEELLSLSPAVAATWLNTVPLPDRTDDMIERTAREWLRVDPVAAQRWMDETIVLPERREQLLREVNR